MFFGFNWVDLIIVIILLTFVWEAVGRPLILELLGFLSFLAVFFTSFRAYNLPAKFFESQFKVVHGLSLVLGFLTVWFLSEVILFFIVRLIIPKIPKFKFFGSEFLLIILSILRGLIFISLILVIVATFPIQPSLKRNVLDSKIGSRILSRTYGLEQPLKQIFGGVSNESLTFLTIKPKTDEKIDLGFQTTQFGILGDAEAKMFDLINSERIKVGVKPLIFNPQLREIARAHSADMFQRGYFSHYSPEGFSVADRVVEAGINFLIVGENLAYAPDVQLAHKGLMNSKGHRENILSTDYGKIGIGVMDAGVYEQMFTEVFSN